MSRPEPRPALQRSDDGAVHPAAPRVATEQHIHPAPHAPSAVPADEKRRKGAKKMDRAPDSGPTLHEVAVADPVPSYTGKPVQLAVTVPKDLRKKTRKLADKEGASVDDVVVEALAHLIARRS